MKSKGDIRKQLEAELTVFLSQGNHINKIGTPKQRGRKSEPKEKIVEIEVDHLPKALQVKFFAE